MPDSLCQQSEFRCNPICLAANTTVTPPCLPFLVILWHEQIVPRGPSELRAIILQGIGELGALAGRDTDEFRPIPSVSAFIIDSLHQFKTAPYSRVADVYWPVSSASARAVLSGVLDCSSRADRADAARSGDSGQGVRRPTSIPATGAWSQHTCPTIFS
jgi:hypothetical protein